MRPGFRARAPARADGATQWNAHPQLWGEPAWAYTPDLDGGTDPRTKNAVGCYHSGTSGNYDDVTDYRSAGGFAYITEYDSGVTEFTGVITGSGLLTVTGTVPGGRGIQVGDSITWDTTSSVGQVAYVMSQNSGTTGGNGTYTVSPTTNRTSRTMWARHRYANRDGGRAFGRVADPVNSGRYCTITRVIQDDPDAATQEGRKTMPRSEGSAAGVMSSYDAYLCAFSVLVPTATREMYTGTYYTEDAFGVHNRTGWGMGSTLIWQNKTGGPIAHSIWLAARGDTSPNQTGPYFSLRPPEVGASRMPKMLIDFPADTWIHFIVLQRHGVMPWANGMKIIEARQGSGQYWGAQVHNAGYAYVAVSPTGFSERTSTTAPTHTNTSTGTCSVGDWVTRSDLGANFRVDATPSSSAANWTNIGAGTGSGQGRGTVASESQMTSLTAADVQLNSIRWRCLGAMSRTDLTDPRTVIWAAIGNAAYNKVADVTDTNIPYYDGGAGNIDAFNTQWGWYTLQVPDTFDVYGAGDSGSIDQATITSYPNSGWTASSDGSTVVSRTEKILYWKDPVVAKPAIANQYRNSQPDAATLAHWFDVLRSR